MVAIRVATDADRTLVAEYDAARSNETPEPDETSVAAALNEVSAGNKSVHAAAREVMPKTVARKKRITYIWIVCTQQNKKLSAGVRVESTQIHNPAFLSEQKAQEYARRLNEGYEAEAKTKGKEQQRYANAGRLWLDESPYVAPTEPSAAVPKSNSTDKNYWINLLAKRAKELGESGHVRSNLVKRTAHLSTDDLKHLYETLNADGREAYYKKLHAQLETRLMGLSANIPPLP
jgi:hypothetical protein